MESLRNLDLLSVGIAIAGIGILGFSVFFSNKRSITNRSFLYFSLLTIIWSAANYLAYQIRIPEISFWLFRVVIAIAVWHAFFFFQMSYVFPKENINFKKWYKFILTPLVFISSIINLTPLVFSKITSISSDGKIEGIENGPAIALFSALVAFFVIGGIVQFFRKTLKAPKEEKKQFQFVSLGIFITFILLMIFNFILPAFFNNPQYIPLGAVSIFPYVALTGYAIIRYHLLNIKVIATEILAFILAVVTLYEVILSEGLLLIILRSGIFLLVFSLGILLIRSVRREVEQRQKLEVLTQELEEYVGFAAHQVRGPMAVVKGFAQLIADGSYGKVSEDAQAKAVEIKNKSDELIALVNNLLDVRKIESGEFLKDFKLEETDIVAFVRRMVEGYKIVAQKKNLNLAFESAASQVLIKIDRQKIQQVIQNLLDNSIKYTPQGFIKVNIQDEDKSVLISVIDSGIGLSKTLKAKLFERFTRGEDTKREIQGTGLGLYIAKQIVAAHKGEIWAESDGEGRGSKFFVRLRKLV